MSEGIASEQILHQNDLLGVGDNWSLLCIPSIGCDHKWAEDAKMAFSYWRYNEFKATRGNWPVFDNYYSKLTFIEVQITIT